MLVVASAFPGGSWHADYYKPWLETVNAAGIDVSYKAIDSGYGLLFADWRPDEDGRPLLAKELQGFDVIVLDQGGAFGLGSVTLVMLGTGSWRRASTSSSSTGRERKGPRLRRTWS